MSDYGFPEVNWWKVAGAVVLIFVVVTIVGLIGGWFSGTANLVGFGHTQEQTTAVLGDWTALKQEACNVLSVKDSKTSTNDPTLVEDPAFAYKAVYRKTEADYNRRMNNFFEAKLTRGIPIPGGIQHLPQFAPSLKQAEIQFASEC